MISGHSPRIFAISNERHTTKSSSLEANQQSKARRHANYQQYHGQAITRSLCHPCWIGFWFLSGYEGP